MVQYSTSVLYCTVLYRCTVIMRVQYTSHSFTVNCCEWWHWTVACAWTGFPCLKIIFHIFLIFFTFFEARVPWTVRIEIQMWFWPAACLTIQYTSAVLYWVTSLCVSDFENYHHPPLSLPAIFDLFCINIVFSYQPFSITIVIQLKKIFVKSWQIVDKKQLKVAKFDIYNFCFIYQYIVVKLSTLWQQYIADF